MDAQSAQRDSAIVFISYAPKDQRYLTQLEVCLKSLERQGLLRTWSHQQIGAGTLREQAIDTQLNEASIILLLVSPDFIASDYCYSVEMERAMKRHEANEVRVIPILLRPIDLTGTPIEQLQFLPLNGKPITRWQNRDQAWHEVVKGIRTTIEDLQMLIVRSPSSSLPRVWNVPYSRNPFFTGRDVLLIQLAMALRSGAGPVQPQAIIGMGGIGKTQIALEYAYRFQEDYQAVLWAQADTHEVLFSAFVTCAQLLNLPEKDAQDQQIVVSGLLQWMKTHSKWLLILDNAEDLAMVSEFIPPTHGGHIILTTRVQAMGRLAQRVEVEMLLPEVAALFLLKRSGLAASDASLDQASPVERAAALEIVRELGCLPLALDQAGAYMEESQVSPRSYLNLYRWEQAALLEQRRGVIKDHPESVVTSLSISFKAVEQINPVAADLLHLCAFLHSDAIPEEIITSGIAHPGSLLQSAADPVIFNNAINVLRNYSLIKRDVSRNTLNIHRLVQVVLIHILDSKTYLHWAERTVRTLSEVFPEAEAATWTRCERCLPHGLSCIQLIEQNNMEFSEAVHLLMRVGWYLAERAQYRDAEPIVRRALEINTQQLPDHVDTAQILNVLAGIYYAQGRYAEAEPLYLRGLKIYERILGPEHLHTVRNLNNLASLYAAQGRYNEAEPLYRRTLAIHEQTLGAEHPDTAGSLNNLAELYLQMGKYTEAEPLMQKALIIYEQFSGPDHPNTAASLNNLAELYCQQGKYSKAEPLYLRALTICEQLLGRDHPDTATSLNNLAGLYLQLRDYVKAEALYLRASAIYEQLLDPNHPDIATSLNNLAGLYCEQEEYAKAQPLLDRALKICELRLGHNHLDTATSLHNLARLYDRQGQYVEAEPLYQRALTIRQQQLGHNHPHTFITFEKYSELLQKMGRNVQDL
jgi:tetratricopeptide (TPR) repeat protein